MSSTGPGTGGGGSGPGTGGSGGQGASGVGGAGGGGGVGSGGGAGGCEDQVAACTYKTDTEFDAQSFRQIAGYNCFHPSSGWDFVATKTCDYTEQCVADAGTTEAACVACGPTGVRFAQRVVDGQVVEDCKGCKCGGGWKVYGCYAETATYGAPWADVVWQQGSDVIRFALLGSGEVKSLAGLNKEITIQNLQVNSFEIQPDGLVDFGIEAQVIHTDNFQMQHTWDMQARVVRICN